MTADFAVCDLCYSINLTLQISTVSEPADPFGESDSSDSSDKFSTIPKHSHKFQRRTGQTRAPFFIGDFRPKEPNGSKMAKDSSSSSKPETSRNVKKDDSENGVDNVILKPSCDKNTAESSTGNLYMTVCLVMVVE